MLARKPWKQSAGQGSLAAFPAVMHFTPKCTCLLAKMAWLQHLSGVLGKEVAAVGFSRLCRAGPGVASEVHPTVSTSMRDGFAANVLQYYL